MPNDRQYEFVYVLAPTVANAEVEALQRELEDQIGKLGGAVENTDLWGRRKLAYPIGNFTEGIYVVQLIHGPGAMVTELERRMRVHDDVLRYLTVRVDDDLRKARRAAEKRKSDAERRRAARAPVEAPAPPPAAGLAGESPADAEPRAGVTPAATGGQPSPAGPGAAPAEGGPPAAPSAEPAASPAEPAASPAESAASPAESAASPAESAASPAEPAAPPAEPAAPPAEEAAPEPPPAAPPDGRDGA